MKIDIQNSLTLIFSPISIVLVDAGTSPSLPGLAIIPLAELFSLSCPFFIVLSQTFSFISLITQTSPTFLGLQGVFEFRERFNIERDQIWTPGENFHNNFHAE